MLAKLPEERMRLLEAADYMEEHGFCKHYLFDEDGGVCALGAIVKASGRNFGFELSSKDLLSVVHLTNFIEKTTEFRGQLAIPLWNNAPERTQAEVVATLRAAAVWGL